MLYVMLYYENHYVVPDVVAVHFLMAHDSVRESDNLQVCLQVNAGLLITQRNVSFSVFTVGGIENSGKLL